jgi:hypothetical protein
MAARDGAAGSLSRERPAGTTVTTGAGSTGIGAGEGLATSGATAGAAARAGISFGAAFLDFPLAAGGRTTSAGSLSRNSTTGVSTGFTSARGTSCTGTGTGAGATIGAGGAGGSPRRTGSTRKGCIDCACASATNPPASANSSQQISTVSGLRGKYGIQKFREQTLVIFGSPLAGGASGKIAPF